MTTDPNTSVQPYLFKSLCEHNFLKIYNCD